MSFKYQFSVVRGTQAMREYYIAMIPLGLLNKLFHSEDEYVPPEYRAQRRINETRIPEIKDYILSNRNTYVFSALSASIDGQFSFIPSELDSNIGILEVDMNATFLINDGQHRKAAIESALQEAPDLANETISVVLFEDEGLNRSQQMFADLNKHAVKSSMSLSTLYDNRDEFSNLVKKVVTNVSFLNKYTDKERDNLGKNSGKLFTLANFVRANRRIIKDEVRSGDEDFLISFWNAVFTVIPEWQMLESKQMTKASLREDYVLTLSVTMQALGRLGSYLYENKCDNKVVLEALSKIDWTRSNPDWAGRIVDRQGKIINTDDAIIKMCNLFKQRLDIKLTKEEMVKENELRK